MTAKLKENNFGALMLTKQNPNSSTLQRSNGLVRIAFKTRGGETVLDDLFQQGSAKVKLGRKETSCLTEAVLINTSGGMTGGDRLETHIHWQQNTTAILTTQAAERCYKSIGGSAKITSHLKIDSGATGLWLPQETIMFDEADYQRQTIVKLENDSQFLGVESSIFGRTAMGETITQGHLKETWSLWCKNQLLFKDAFALDGHIDKKLNQPAIANGAKAISTIIYYGPLARDISIIANFILGNQPIIGHATSFDKITIVRILSPDGQQLRTATILLLNQLLIKVTNNKTERALLPRVWNM